MTQIPLPAFLDDAASPLPIRVAHKWSFSLATSYHETQLLYSIRDWIVGLTGASNPIRIWSDIKRFIKDDLVYVSIVESPYTAPNGKVYQSEFTSDTGLYLIAQHMRRTKQRPLLNSIKQYLAASGAFVDLVSRKPETIVTSGLIDPETAFEAGITEYRKRGKPDSWITIRVESKIKREMFINALNTAVIELLNESHYRTATDDIYIGLWKRTAAQLKGELRLSKRESLRDNQPALGLAYQGIAEEVSAQKLGNQRLLSWYQARTIVQKVAQLIGVQAQQTSRFLKTDLATGKPLLTAGR